MKLINKGVLTTIFLLCCICCAAQTTEFVGTVDLKPKAKVYKLLTIPDCEEIYRAPDKKGSTKVEYQKKLTNGKTEITITNEAQVADGEMILANKKLRISMFPDAQGKAELYLDDKDKSVLYVNYWLNGKQTVKAGHCVEYYTPFYECKDVPVDKIVPDSKRKLLTDETFYRAKVYEGTPETKTTWFTHSDKIKVFDKKDNFEYYLVDHYQRDAKYILELENREYLPYASFSFVPSVLVIPFKYRFGYNDDVKGRVKDDVSAAINAGVFGGFKLTKYRIINKAGTYRQSSSWAFRAGPFVNFSSIALDKSNTSHGETPLIGDAKANMAVFSPGLGFTGELKSVQFGIFIGKDFGMGSERKNWNFNDRTWLGFGLGLKLTDLFGS